LKVFENSTIWRPLQEDQDCTIPPSFDLEERTGQSNAFPKAPSAHQENPKFLPVIPLLPTKLSSDELKDKAVYFTFTLQVSKGSAPGTRTYRKSISTFEEGETPAVDGSHHSPPKIGILVLIMHTAWSPNTSS
jgi:hypothetical protein